MNRLLFYCSSLKINLLMCMQEVMYSLVPLAIFILSTLYALCRLRRVHTTMDVDIFRTVSYKNLQR